MKKLLLFFFLLASFSAFADVVKKMGTQIENLSIWLLLDDKKNLNIISFDGENIMNLGKIPRIQNFHYQERTYMLGLDIIGGPDGFLNLWEFVTSRLQIKQMGQE